MEWIKLYKKFQDWEWYKNSNTKCLFIHLLLNANWKDGKYQGYEIKRGSLVVGLNALSEQTGMTIQQIRTSLNHLLSTNEIVKKSTNRFSIITIVKYEDYQRDTREDNKQLTNKQQTTNKQLTTIEEYKTNRHIDNKKEKYKKEKKYFDNEKLNNLFNKFYEEYPKKKSKGNVEKWFLKNKPSEELVNKMIEKVNILKKTSDWKKENGKYIPYPSTWLNAKGWEDEITNVDETYNMTEGGVQA